MKTINQTRDKTFSFQKKIVFGKSENPRHITRVICIWFSDNIVYRLIQR